MKSGSFESLNVSERWGCRLNARQMRLTALWDIPSSRAIDRVLQWVESRGFASSVLVMTRSTLGVRDLPRRTRARLVQ